jgi:hypothetical protein
MRLATTSLTADSVKAVERGRLLGNVSVMAQRIAVGFPMAEQLRGRAKTWPLAVRLVKNNVLAGADPSPE